MNTKKRIQVLLNQLRREKKEEMCYQLKGEEKILLFCILLFNIKSKYLMLIFRNENVNINRII